MLSRIIETLKYSLLEYRFYYLSIVLLLVLLIYNHNKTLTLEKELVRVNNELHVKQVTSERRQKAYDEKVKQQQEKLERMIKEIKSHK
ncbi:hypothetical protein CLU83_0506 [Flavobacterium sp. 1]|uniref:hypothetical protein n=1 Tax=Flavobacterium sp. 1 TaxID=2035200 RepID=UPI000C246695|nr:hypothetical protein [Flavobacterium sp. 1]PJJ07343.1 hypothetical protein CLU83_0506 [Flavobacterium sp. 1]